MKYKISFASIMHKLVSQRFLGKILDKHKPDTSGKIFIKFISTVTYTCLCFSKILSFCCETEEKSPEWSD